MDENTASDRMENRRIEATLPDAGVQQFLLNVIDQTAFPGKMAEYVANVKALVAAARIGA